jgi:hypothetical protein
VQAALPARAVGTEREFQRAVFKLAQHLKAVGELHDQPAKELKPLVKQWYEQASARLGGRSFTEVYAEFIGAWNGARYAAGDDVVKRAWELAQQQPPPPAGATYDEPKVGLLINLCRQLQQENERSGWGAGFALSGYVVEGLLGVCQRTAANWLKMLVADGVLAVTAAGGNVRDGVRLAREYRVVQRH